MSWIWEKRTSCTYIFFELHQIHDVGGWQLRAGQRVARRRHRPRFGRGTNVDVVFHVNPSVGVFSPTCILYSYPQFTSFKGVHPTLQEFRFLQPLEGPFSRWTGAGWRWHSAWWKNLILTRMASCFEIRGFRKWPSFLENFRGFNTNILQLVGEEGTRQYEFQVNMFKLIWIYARNECFGAPCTKCALRRCKLCWIHEGLQPIADADGLCLLVGQTCSNVWRVERQWRVWYLHGLLASASSFAPVHTASLHQRWHQGVCISARPQRSAQAGTGYKHRCQSRMITPDISRYAGLAKVACETPAGSTHGDARTGFSARPWQWSW